MMPESMAVMVLVPIAFCGWEKLDARQGGGMGK